MSHSEFIHESVVYQLLSDYGIKVPKFETDLEKLSFRDGEPVVIKGLANNLWHKSDEGALHFLNFNKKEIIELDKKMRQTVGLKYEWITTMVCSRSNFKTANGLPSEAYVSIQSEDACGTIISFGVGGIHAEAWAAELASNVLMWSPILSTPEQALAEIKTHWLGKVWLGELRQGKTLTDNNKILNFLKGLWKLALNLEKKNIKLLEMNPVVIDEYGDPIALDGVGNYTTDAIFNKFPICIPPKVLLDPRKIAIAGVSEKVGSFGLRILTNLVDSKLQKNNIKIIKPGIEEFLGIKCYPDLKNLLDDPVDILILTLPAVTTVKILNELCEQGFGAAAVYLVAGGIGDSGDTSGLAVQIHTLLNSRRERGLWTPYLIGPNSLGIVLSVLNLSTLFIAPEKLPIKFHPNGNTAFISQSGAFFITRFSQEENLPIKYGFCIGNQMDLKVSDFLEKINSDNDIKVIGIYIEGFSKNEALHLAEASKEIIKTGKHIILYKGGRSAEGMKAAAGHTGAMAGNYELQKKILKIAGIYITENFQEFSSILNFLSCYPNYKYASKLAVISNAGFETVSSADNIGPRLMPLTESIKTELEIVLQKCGLAGLVGAANPLDLTPMADSAAYFECAEVFSKSEAEAILFCLVPLTDKLNTIDTQVMNNFAKNIKNIADQKKKPILVVIDAGSLYDNYRDAFKLAGLPTFKSIEDAFLALEYKKL